MNEIRSIDELLDREFSSEEEIEEFVSSLSKEERVMIKLYQEEKERLKAQSRDTQLGQSYTLVIPGNNQNGNNNTKKKKPINIGTIGYVGTGREKITLKAIQILDESKLNNTRDDTTRLDQGKTYIFKIN